MSPKVRLPLVELTSPTKAEVVGSLASLYESYSDCMIGKVSGLEQCRFDGSES